MRRSIIVLLLFSFLVSAQYSGVTVSLPSNGTVRVQFYSLKGRFIQTPVHEMEDMGFIDTVAQDHKVHKVYLLSIFDNIKISEENPETETEIPFFKRKREDNLFNAFSELFNTSEEWEPKKQTTVLFMNGVNNTYEMAIASAMDLFEEVESTLKERYPDEIFDFKLAYNQRHNIGVDMMEVFLQKQEEIAGKVLLGEPETKAGFRFFFRRLYPWGAYHFNDEVQHEEAFDKALDQMELLGFSRKEIQDFKDSCDIRVREWYRKALQTRPETTEGLVSLFRDAMMKEGRTRILVVAHSQGNLYTNDVYDYLPEYQNSIGIIHVASPSRRMNGWHWTNDNDQVINGVRNEDSLVPEGKVNVVISGDSANHPWDKRFHKFSESYFHEDLISRDSIVNQLYYLCETVPFYSDTVQKALIDPPGIKTWLLFKMESSPFKLQSYFDAFDKGELRKLFHLQ